MLHCACSSDKLEIAQYLVSVCKADVQAKNEKGDSVLHWACRPNGKLEIIQYLISVGKADVQANKNERGDTVLHWACNFGKLEIVQYLISVGKANVQVKNVRGDTPVHVCSYPQAVCHMLSMSVTQLPIKGSQGMTPLHHACRTVSRNNIPESGARQ